MVSLLEFYELLEKHDWYYAMSDDGKAYRHGKENEIALKNIAEQSDEHHDLYRHFYDSAFSGPAFGTNVIPKPTKPQE